MIRVMVGGDGVPRTGGRGKRRPYDDGGGSAARSVSPTGIYPIRTGRITTSHPAPPRPAVGTHGMRR
jgi:hypothetical protein